jgi:hypothetical protein
MNKILLLIILVLGFLLRFYLIQQNGFVIDSDEAIVGLMAKHLLEGASFPIFYYGQDYMGSLEAIVTSLVFRFFGQSNLSLKATPLIFSVIHIYLVYLITRNFISERFSLLAAAFCAFAPNALVLWSGKTRGGFIELVVLGSLCFLLSFKVLDRKKWALIPLTFFLGLGWWTNNQIVFYIIPMGVFCGYSLFRTESFLSFLKLSVASVLAFILGSSPFWYANILLEPKWATFKVLFGGTGDVDTIRNFKGFFLEALPILLGARKFWTETDFFLGASLLAYLLFAISLFLFYRNKSKNNLVLSFLVTVAFVFCFSKFGWLSKAPRYLLPLYSVVPVIYAVGASEIFKRYGKNLSVFFSVCILSLQVFPVFTTNGMIEGMPIVFQGQRVQRDHRPLYDWLEQQGYSFIDTNYWIGYRVAFETNERVQFAVFGEPQTVRIKKYELESLSQPLVYILVPLEAQKIKNTLAHFGFTYRETQVGEYVAIDKISANWKLGSEVKINKEHFKTELKPESLNLMLDGEITTRWGSAKPQSPGMSIDIDLTQHQGQITALELDFGSFTHDAPRHLQVLGEDFAGNWHLLSDLGTLGDVFTYFPDDHGRPSRKWIIRFSAKKLKTIKLLQQGQHPVFDWSIAELKVYGGKQ